MRRSYRAAYDAYSRRVLDRIADREARREIAEDPDYQPRTYMQGVAGRPQRLFYARQFGGPGDFSLVYRVTWSGVEKVLLDVRRRSTEAASWTVESATPSYDGKHVVAGLQRDGSEQPYLEILDVDRGEVLPDRLTADNEPRLHWHPDGRSVFYSTTGGDVYEHALGGGADRLMFGASMPELKIPKTSYVSVSAAIGSRWLMGDLAPGAIGFPGAVRRAARARGRRPAIKVHEAFRYAPGEPIASARLYPVPAPSSVVANRVVRDRQAGDEHRAMPVLRPQRHRAWIAIASAGVDSRENSSRTGRSGHPPTIAGPAKERTGLGLRPASSRCLCAHRERARHIRRSGALNR
jgi:hypothetical protein